ncbi:UDP-N-acetylmuramoyl-tripeptide--D-alanyl-D-alanine ligase [Bulleidia sp. zg-1006]|nr:UDP-N-acetylmuramoyl-tripeptide--D-alanyl-D-alanine ligase [Bulleidia sp. zg-1006]
MIGMSLLLSVMYRFQNQFHITIKPLVLTSRVKRQLFISFLLVGLTIFSFIYFRLDFLWLLCLTLSPWLYMYLVGWLTYPFEKAIQQYYIHLGKKRLYAQTDLIKIGITGSYGKTSTKNIIHSIVREEYNALMTPASYNTPMGITMTIRHYLKPIHQVFICEMGADHRGEIKRLMKYVQPQIGVVTSIGPQHLLTFGSLENIIAEKMQMIECLPKENGLGVINLDNPYIRQYKVKNKVPLISFGIQSKDADYRAVKINYTATGSYFTVIHAQEEVRFHTKLLGELNIMNILSGIVVSRHLGVSWKSLQRAVANMEQVEHRLELKKMNGYRFIDDAFNANPIGAKISLEVLSMMPGKRYIITPGMIDLGKKQDEYNREFGKQMKHFVDEVILVGPKQTKAIQEGLAEMNFDSEHIHVYQTVKEAFSYVYEHANEHDTILLENDLPEAFSR